VRLGRQRLLIDVSDETVTYVIAEGDDSVNSTIDVLRVNARAGDVIAIVGESPEPARDLGIGDQGNPAVQRELVHS